jgi:hypothetical protein
MSVLQLDDNCQVGLDCIIKAIYYNRPCFQNLVYCDDHILIGDGRSFETIVSGIVRRAMVTVVDRVP